MSNSIRVFSNLLTSMLVALSAANTGAASQCDFRPIFTRPDERGTMTVKVYEAKAVSLPNGKHPLLFITSLKVNTDGALISYNQDDPTGNRCEEDPGNAPCAINNIRNAYRDFHKPVEDFIAIRNAGYPPEKTWRVLSPDIIEKDSKTGKPCITREGYLVSMTADVAVNGGHSKAGDCDPSKWIDALTAPAIVLPKKTRALPSQFASAGLGMRSLVVGVSADASHRTVAGIVGDLGPAKEIGETNIAMNRELNGLPALDQPKSRKDAVRRFQAGRTAILLFPGTDFILDRPITGARIKTAGDDAIAKVGGVSKIVQCILNELDPGF